MKLTLGVQLYTLRHETANVKNVPDVFRFVKSTGAETVQLSAMPTMPAEDIAKIAADSGLTVCSTHAPFDRLENDLDRLCEEHRVFGCPTIGLSSIPPKFNKKSLDGIKKFAETLNNLQKRVEENGLYLHYHNHAFEFKKINGKRILDILYEELDPAVAFCLDAYWAHIGGVDPCEYVDKLGTRLCQIHMKDYKKWRPFPFNMAPPGKGILNYPALLTKAEQYGTRAALIELDIAKNPREAIQEGMDYLINNYKNQ